MPGKLKAAFLAWMLVSMLSSTLGAVTETRLPPQQEDRAKVLFHQLRCVVCQNQSIGDSDADVARDLRGIVREQITAGKTDTQIKEYLVARYGEFILLNPVLAWHTLVLWIAPIALLLLGGIIALVAFRSRKAQVAESELSQQEQAQLAEILDKNRD